MIPLLFSTQLSHYTDYDIPDSMLKQVVHTVTTVLQ